MKTPLLAAMTALLVLGACGTVRDSRLNPFNWFGSSRSEATSLVSGSAVMDHRTVVDQVAELRVDRMPGGAIIHAVGITPTQGWWDAELIAENNERPSGGVLTYRFVVAEPQSASRVSTEASRRVTVAHFIPDRRLEDVSRIVVQGARNQRTAGR